MEIAQVPLNPWSQVPFLPFALWRQLLLWFWCVPKTFKKYFYKIRGFLSNIVDLNSFALIACAIFNIILYLKMQDGAKAGLQ